MIKPERGSLLRQFAGGVAVTMGRRLLALALGVGWASLLARSLGPRDAGTVMLAVFVAVFGMGIFNLGFPWSTAYMVARSRFGYRETAAMNLALCAVLSPVAGALGYGIFKAIVAVGGLSPAPVIALGVLGIPALLSLHILAGLYQGKQDFGGHAVITLTPLVVALTVGLLLVLVGRAASESLMLAWLGGQYLTLIGLSWRLTRDGKWPGRSRFIAYVAESIAYGWKLHVGEFANTMRSRVDNFLLGSMSGLASVGIYASAMRIVERLSIISHAAMFVIFPLSASLERDESARRRITPIVARWNLSLSLLGAALLAVLARPLVLLLFGEAFERSVVPLVLLLPGVVALSMSRVLTGDIAARGRSDITLWLNLLAMAINIVANLIMIPIWGIGGAAIASSLTNVANTALRAVVYRRLTGVSLRSLVLPNREDAELLRRLTKAASTRARG